MHRPGKSKPAFFNNRPALSGNRADAPANDDPCGVTVDILSIGQTLTWAGTTEGSDGEVWQAFTLSSCANVSFNFCGTSPGYGNDYIFPQGGECDNFISEYYPPLSAPDCDIGFINENT